MTEYHTTLISLRNRLQQSCVEGLAQFDHRDIDIAHYCATLYILTGVIPIDHFLDTRLSRILTVSSQVPHFVLHALQSTLILLRVLFDRKQDALMDAMVKDWRKNSSLFSQGDDIFGIVYEQSIRREYDTIMATRKNETLTVPENIILEKSRQ